MMCITEAGQQANSRLKILLDFKIDWCSSADLTWNGLSSYSMVAKWCDIFLAEDAHFFHVQNLTQTTSQPTVFSK